jgi:hypothetical protein
MKTPQVDSLACWLIDACVALFAGSALIGQRGQFKAAFRRGWLLDTLQQS